MVRRNFSNPLLMMRPFSGGRKRTSSPETDKQENEGVKQDRKISIDQTVLSGDDSRLNPSQGSSPSSFDAEPEILRTDSAPGLPVEEGEENRNAKPKEQPPEPSFFTHHPRQTALSWSRSHEHEPAAPPQRLVHPSNSHPQRRKFALAPQRASSRSPLLAVPAPRPPSPSGASCPGAGGAVDPALRARAEAVRIQQQLLGENHPDVIFALSSLAKLHKRRGNHFEAASILRESQMRSRMAKSTPSLLPSKGRNGLLAHPNANVPTEISFPH